jgi:hypothetical protein
MTDSVKPSGSSSVIALSPWAAARPSAIASIAENPTPASTNATMRINEIYDHPYSTTDTRTARGRESTPTVTVTSL